MKNLGIEIKWAIVFTITGLLWMTLEKVSGFHGPLIHQHARFSVLFAIPAIAIFVLALLDKRKHSYEGYINYKQAFASGLILTVFIAILSPLSQFITSTVISPGFFTNASAFAVDQGAMTNQEAARYFNLPNYILQGFIGAIIMGVITTTIVSIFIRRKRPA